MHSFEKKLSKTSEERNYPNGVIEVNPEGLVRYVHHLVDSRDLKKREEQNKGVIVLK